MNQHPTRLTLSLSAVLRTLLTPLGGVLEVASDPDHLLEMLETSPQQFRVILLWGGYDSDENANLGMSKDRMEVVIQCAKGLHISPGHAQMVARPGDRPPMIELVEKVREWILAMRYPVDSGTDPDGYTLVNSAWLSIEGLSTLQHQLTFTLRRAMTSHPTTIEVPLL